MVQHLRATHINYSQLNINNMMSNNQPTPLVTRSRQNNNSSQQIISQQSNKDQAQAMNQVEDNPKANGSQRKQSDNQSSSANGGSRNNRGKSPTSNDQEFSSNGVNDVPQNGNKKKNGRDKSHSESVGRGTEDSIKAKGQQNNKKRKLGEIVPAHPIEEEKHSQSDNEHQNKKKRKLNSGSADDQSQSDLQNVLMPVSKNNSKQPRKFVVPGSRQDFPVSSQALENLLEQSEAEIKDEVALHQPGLELLINPPEGSPKVMPMYVNKVINMDGQKVIKDQEIHSIPNFEQIEIPLEDIPDVELRQLYSEGQVLDNQIYCNQTIITRSQADGHTRVLWAIINMGEPLLDSSAQVFSPAFILPDETAWQLVFQPKVAIENGKEYILASRLAIVALPTPGEYQQTEDGLQCKMKRRIQFSVSHNGKIDGSFQQLKSLQGLLANFTSEQNQCTISKFFTLKRDQQLKMNHHRQLLISLYIKPEVYFEPDESRASGVLSQPAGGNQQEAPPAYQTRRRTRGQIQHKYNGLINEGTTCYLNSLLQTLFVIRAFRKAVYDMPTNIDDFKSIPFCLQRIFYNLQTGKRAVRTFELLNAFGWSQREMNQQHDVNEFFLVLSETLEKQMQGTPVSGTYSQLFEGVLENVVKCININFESSRKESFNCIQLSIGDGKESIEDSILSYVASEELVGENQYDAEDHGKQDAKKFIRFKKLPPVLQIQVNRFAFDLQQGQMNKINSQFKFSEILDIDAILPGETNLSQNVLPYSQLHRGAAQKKGGVRNLYHLHSILIHRGTLGAGHYFAFIRPSLDDSWFEFNDEKVIPMVKQTALSIGSGGFDTYFEHRDGAIFEKVKSNNTNAYMLVYIRDQDREEVMSEVPITDIPEHLCTRFNEENKLNDKLEDDMIYLRECGSVQIVTFDIFKEWSENGLMQTPHDIYQTEKFQYNDDQRLLLKCDRKDKISDLLLRLRKKKKIPLISDLNIYKVRYSPRQQCYTFFYIPPEEYQTDIFGQKNKPTQIFFICNNKNPRAPLLRHFTNKESIERDRRCKQLIDFVRRRDLDRQYVQVYEAREKEIWRFVTYDKSGMPLAESDFNEQYVSAIEQSGISDFDDDQQSCEENGAGQDMNDEATEDIAKNFSNQRLNEDVEMIDTQQVDVQMNNEAINENPGGIDPKDQVLIFIKIFELIEKKNLMQSPHFEERKEDVEFEERLRIVTPMLLNRNLLLSQAKEMMIKELTANLGEAITAEHQLLFEQPFRSSDEDQFKMLNANSHQLDDEESGFLKTRNLENVSASMIENGSIVIFAKESEMDQLEIFLKEKSKEVWVYIKDQSPESQRYDSDKMQMSYQDQLPQICRRIKEHIHIFEGENVNQDHIQIYDSQNNKVPYGAHVNVHYLLQDDNILCYEILPYPLKDLEGRVIVRVQHYLIDNTPGQIYNELVPQDLNIWRFLKHLKELYLNDIDGEILTKHYIVTLRDKNDFAIIKIVDPKESLKDVINNFINGRGFILAVQPYSQEEIEELMKVERSLTSLLFCVVVDQYTRKLGSPFIVFSQKNMSIEEVRNAIIQKMLSLRMLYEYGQDENKNSIFREITFEQKENFILNTVDFKTSRRQVEYSAYSLSELPKDAEYLDYKKADFINIGVEIHVIYQADEEKRPGGHGLKIYSNNNQN